MLIFNMDKKFYGKLNFLQNNASIILAKLFVVQLKNFKLKKKLISKIWSKVISSKSNF